MSLIPAGSPANSATLTSSSSFSFHPCTGEKKMLTEAANTATDHYVGQKILLLPFGHFRVLCYQIELIDHISEKYQLQFFVIELKCRQNLSTTNNNYVHEETRPKRRILQPEH